MLGEKNDCTIKLSLCTSCRAFTIGIVQSVFASILTDIALLLLHFVRPDMLSTSAAITLGAIASATAPAATLMVVRQFKAKGEVTSLLLPIVALDDAVGLIVFVFLMVSLSQLTIHVWGELEIGFSSLTAAGEIKEKPKDVIDRRANKIAEAAKKK